MKPSSFSDQKGILILNRTLIVQRAAWPSVHFLGVVTPQTPDNLQLVKPSNQFQAEGTYLMRSMKAQKIDGTA